MTVYVLVGWSERVHGVVSTKEQATALGYDEYATERGSRGFFVECCVDGARVATEPSVSLVYLYYERQGSVLAAASLDVAIAELKRSHGAPLDVTWNAVETRRLRAWTLRGHVEASQGRSSYDVAFDVQAIPWVRA